MNSELHEFSIIIYNFSKHFLKKYGFAPFMFTPFVGKHVVFTRLPNQFVIFVPKTWISSICCCMLWLCLTCFNLLIHHLKETLFLWDLVFSLVWWRINHFLSCQNFCSKMNGKFDRFSIINGLIYLGKKDIDKLGFVWTFKTYLVWCGMSHI